MNLKNPTSGPAESQSNTQIQLINDSLPVRRLERLDYTEAANVKPIHAEVKKPPSRWLRALYFWVHARL